MKADILSHVDSVPALAGKVETGGRLDVCRAIPGCQDAPAQPPPPPPPPPQVAVSPFQTEVAHAVIRSLKVSPFAFEAARSGPAIVRLSRKRTLRPGAIVSYRDNMAAAAEFTVFVLRSGVLGAAHRCVAHPGGRRAHSRLRPCIRALYAGHFTRHDRAGTNKFRFSGRIGHVRLRPGSYRLRAVPVFSGVPGTAAVAGFHITG